MKILPTMVLYHLHVPSHGCYTVFLTRKFFWKFIPVFALENYWTIVKLDGNKKCTWKRKSLKTEIASMQHLISQKLIHNAVVAAKTFESENYKTQYLNSISSYFYPLDLMLFVDSHWLVSFKDGLASLSNSLHPSPESLQANPPASAPSWTPLSWPWQPSPSMASPIWLLPLLSTLLAPKALMQDC
jgi:hypothetical protein